MTVPQAALTVGEVDPRVVSFSSPTFSHEGVGPITDTDPRASEPPAFLFLKPAGHVQGTSEVRQEGLLARARRIEAGAYRTYFQPYASLDAL
jgi:hypothetical protein